MHTCRTWGLRALTLHVTLTAALLSGVTALQLSEAESSRTQSKPGPDFRKVPGSKPKLHPHPLSFQVEDGRKLQLTQNIRRGMGLEPAVFANGITRWSTQLAAFQHVQDVLDGVQHDIFVTRKAVKRRVQKQLKEVGVAESKACALGKRSLDEDYRLSYFAGLARAARILKKQYGWKHLSTVYWSGADSSSGCGQTANQRENALSILQAQKNADVILVDASQLKAVMNELPDTRIIVVDTFESGSLHPVLMAPDTALGIPRIIGVLKPHSLTPIDRNNGPRLGNVSHLAFLPGAKEMAGFHDSSPVHMTPAMLDKPILSLNHAIRFRYFMDCGGNPDHARFAGFFAQHEDHWPSMPLKARPYDILHLPSSATGSANFSAAKALKAHVQRLEAHLHYIRVIFPGLTVSTGAVDMTPSATVFISPYGQGEWTDLDFQAVMCGCLVIKPGAESFKAYPNVLEPGQMGLSVRADWVDLKEAVQSTLQDLEWAQFTALRATRRFLEMSDMRRYAADVDLALSQMLGFVPKPEPSEDPLKIVSS
ncbi:hypothetical protein WJX73_000086 [Symbiochloris irregularis]|uniref:Uncharacterized protein n=1 Tax=Symbiochloris irregularis TaxID=706552 RepID=A0AAW1NZW4_9CHLO